MSTALRPPMDLDATLAGAILPELRCGLDDLAPGSVTGSAIRQTILQAKPAAARGNQRHAQPWPARGSECDTTAAGSIGALSPTFHEGTAWTRPDKAASPS